MNRLIIVFIGVTLAGCASDPVYLRHQETGQAAQCGPYSTLTWADTFALADRERGCVQDYVRQGYQRVME